MINFKFSMDANGNKVVKVSSKSRRGFSIQTNGNLPLTHTMSIPVYNIVSDEVRGYIGIYGTAAQQETLGML